VAISSIYPNRFHDPAALKMILRRDDLALRWFTGSFVDMTGAPHAGLIFPQVNLAKAAEPSPGLPIVIVQAIAPIDPIFAPAFEQRAERIDSIPLRPDDFNPGFDVYRFDSAGALSDLLSSATPPTQTLDFGHTLDLIGYDVRTPQVRPGATVEVVTYWRVTSPFEQEAILFTHALSGDPDRPVLTQQDTLDAPSWYWTPGDAFAQVHRFDIPADATPRSYPLEVGVYTREGGTRLPVYDAAGSVVDDHVIIGAVEVLSP
jgi:hypothetical protein